MVASISRPQTHHFQAELRDGRRKSRGKLDMLIRFLACDYALVTSYASAKQQASMRSVSGDEKRAKAAAMHLRRCRLRFVTAEDGQTRLGVDGGRLRVAHFQVFLVHLIEDDR